MSNSTGLTGLLPHPHGNETLIEFKDVLCTLATCDLTLAHMDYLPSLPGNAFFAAFFGACLLVQLVLGVKYRTWGYTIAAMLGMMGEIVGYVGRIMMHSNPFSKNNFLVYLVTLTIAPAFLTAAMYLCLARIVVVYGEERSRFRPRTYTIVFCTCDFFALLLQAIGGAIASIATTRSATQMGINIMLAGLSCQVASLLLFSAACIEFGIRLYTYFRTPGYPSNNTSSLPPRATSPTSIRSGVPIHTSLPVTPLFRAFLVGIAIATLTIFIRSCFRVAELSAGFHGALANNQVSFMVLESTMVLLACFALTALHPGVCFQGEWRAANFKLGKQRRSLEDGKRTSASSFDNKDEAPHSDLPSYQTSMASLSRTASVASFHNELTVTALRTTPVRPGDVHIEMLPIYGIPYENTSDQFPRPST